VSPRRKELNRDIREKRRIQILDAALTSYIGKGYNGTDMDQVAAEAGLAKGLLYYYYTNKQELFRAMFDWATGTLMMANAEIVASVAAMADPVERLFLYLRRVVELAEKDPRALRFAMRLPFDAYAVFGPTEWREGYQRSNLHRDTLASMIRDVAGLGITPPLDPEAAANSFWTVFIANCFNFTTMIGGTRPPADAPGGDGTAAPAPARDARTEAARMRQIVTFCFQGLGLPHDAWGKYLERMEKE
jgi:AcrR family transcriptional regulator